MMRKNAAAGLLATALAVGCICTPTPAQDRGRTTVKEQRALLKRAERLNDLMQRLRKSYRAQGRKYFVALLDEGIEHLRKSGLIRNMNEASAALERALTNKAVQAQERVVKDLERLLSILMDRRSVEDLEQDSERVKKQIEQLNRLRTQERKVRERIGQLRDSARTAQERRLTNSLRSLSARELQQAASNAGKSTPLQDELERTLADIAALKKLEKQLDAKLEDSRSSRDNSDDQTLAALQSLVDKLERNLNRLQSQKMAGESAASLERLAQRARQSEASRTDLDNAQRAIERTKREVSRRANGRRGDPSAKQSAAELAKRLDALARELEAAKAGARPDEAVEPEAAKRAANAMSEAAESMREHNRQQAKTGAELSRDIGQKTQQLGKTFKERAKAQGGDPKSSDPRERAGGRSRKLDEQTAQDLAKAAEELAKAADEFDRGQKKDARQSESRRRAEARSQAGMRKLLQAMSRQVSRNQSPESVARQIAERARQAAQNLSSVAGSAKTPQKASEKLDEAAKAMDRASRELAKSQAKRDQARQATAGDRAQSKKAVDDAERMLAAEVKRMRQQATARAGEALARQQEISKAAEQLRKDVAQAAKDGQIAPEQRKAAEQAVKAAQRSMQQAEQQLRRGSPRAAARSQANAANRLDKAARDMERSRPLGPEQRNAMNELARKQRQIAEDILELARRVDPKKNQQAKNKLDEAAKKAEAAAKEMNRGEAQESEQSARDTERKLEEAKRELEEERDRYLRLRQEELLFRIADEVKLLIDKQGGITQQTQLIREAQGDKETLPRKQRSRLRTLGGQEGELAGRARFLAEHLRKEQTLVFTYVLETVAEDLEELKGRMSARRPRVDLPLLALQGDVVRRLKTLASALKDELRRKKKERGEDQKPRNQQNQNKKQNNSNEGDRKRKLVPDIAELRMLKKLEIDARERIEEFMRLRERMPEGLDSWAQSSLRRNALRHARITDLLREFVRTRGLGEEKPAAAEDEGKTKKGKGK